MNTQSYHQQMFDLSYLEQVFQGNKEMIHHIIKLFLDQVPEYIREMELCVERNDLLALHPLAHKAKSSITMLGLRSMEGVVRDIEKRSREHRDMEELPQLVSLVKNDCEKVRGQLSALISSSAA